MTPEVLAWDDASNNRLLASGRGSWIHNPISAYRSIEGQNKELAARSSSPSRRRGWPSGAPSNCRAYGITKFSKNQDAAKAYLEALTDNYREGAKASTGYNMPMLKAFAQPPLPIIQRGPEAEAPRAGRRLPLHHRLPGPVHAGGGRGVPAVHHGLRPGPVLHGQADLEAAVKWAEEKIKAVYAKFA